MELDLTQVIVALAVGLPSTIAALGAVWASLRNSKKLDDNTTLTKVGTQAAANAAMDAKDATAALVEQLNGALDARITKIVKAHTQPLVIAFQEHNDQDQKNMERIEAALKALLVQNQKS